MTRNLPVLAPLLLLTKLWARRADINDASRGSFNSYALFCLLVAFLQMRPQPLLPPLKALFAGLARYYTATDGALEVPLNKHTRKAKAQRVEEVAGG